MNFVRKISPAFSTELRQSFHLSFPLITSEWFYALSGFIGTWMAARLGTQALAAIALASSIYVFVVMMCAGVSSAISVVVAQGFGAGDRECIRQGFAQGYWLTIILSLVTMAAFWMTPYCLPFLIKQNSTLFLLTKESMNAFLWIILPVNLLITMEKFFIGLQRSRLVLFFSLMTVPLEIICTYVLVFGKWGFPHCGIKGFGYGYALAYSIVMIIFVIILVSEPQLRKWQLLSALKSFNGQYLKEIWRIGWPLGILYSVEVGAFLVLIFLMSQFGSDALAAYQIVRQYWVFATVAGFAISETVAVRVGYFVGKKDARAVVTAFLANLVLGLILMGMISLVYGLFAMPLIAVEMDAADPNYPLVLHQAVGFMYAAIAMLLVDIVRLVAAGGLRGLKDTRTVLLSTVLSFWVIGLPAAYGLSFILDGAGLWLGMILGVSVSSLLLFYVFRRLVQAF